THSNGEQNEGGKESVLPNGVGHKWLTLFMCKLTVFLQIGLTRHNAARCWPLINSELQHHEQVQSNQRDQCPRDCEYVQGKKPGKRCTRNDRSTKQEMHC